MGIPAVLYVLAAMQALPVLAIVVLWGRRPPAPLGRLALLCCMFLVSDAVSLVVARLMGTNLWVPYFTRPVEVGFTLWLLAAWQATPRWSQVYVAAIPALGAVSGVLLLLTDPAVSFDRWIGSSQALVALAASLHTGVHRTLSTREVLLGLGWFWICCGLALFWLLYVSVDVFAQTFVATHIDWARTAYFGRAYMLPVTFGLMTWGVLCQRLRAASLGRS